MVALSEETTSLATTLPKIVLTITFLPSAPLTTTAPFVPATTTLEVAISSLAVASESLSIALNTKRAPWLMNSPVTLLASV